MPNQPLNLQSREGKALAVVLMFLGQKGREALREYFLRLSVKDADARETLNVLNDFEVGYDAAKKGAVR